MAEKLTPRDEEVLNQLLNEAVHALVDEAKEKISAKTGIEGGKLSFADKLKIDMADRALTMSARYGVHAKAQKLVDISNKTVPALTSIFGEQALVDNLPPQIKTEEAADILERAGATEVLALVRKAIGPEVAPG